MSHVSLLRYYLLAGFSLCVMATSSGQAQETINLEGEWKRGPAGQANFDPEKEGELQIFKVVGKTIEKRNTQGYIAIYEQSPNAANNYTYLRTLNANGTVAQEAKPGDGLIVVNSANLMTNVLFGQTYFFKRAQAAAGSGKSVFNPGKVNIVFQNKTGKQLDLLWVDYAGKEVAMQSIAQDGSANYLSHKGAYWRFKTGGQQIDDFVVGGDAQQQYVIGSAAAPAAEVVQFTPADRAVDVNGIWKLGPQNKADFDPQQSQVEMLLTKTNTGFEMKNAAGFISIYERDPAKQNTYIFRQVLKPDRTVNYQATDSKSLLVATGPHDLATVTNGSYFYMKRIPETKEPVPTPIVNQPTVKPPVVDPPVVKPPVIVPPTVEIPRSVQGNQVVDLKLDNQYGSRVDIIWVDGQGEEKKLTSLDNKASSSMKSHEGHLFRFKSGETLIQEYRVTNQPAQQVTFRDATPAVVPPKVDPPMQVVEVEPYKPGKQVQVRLTNYLPQPVSLYFKHPNPKVPEQAFFQFPPYLPYVAGMNRAIPISNNFEEGTIFRFVTGDAEVGRYVVSNEAEQFYDLRTIGADAWFSLEQVFTTSRKKQAKSWSDRLSGNELRRLSDDTGNYLGYCVPRMHPYDFQIRGTKGSVPIFDTIDANSTDYYEIGSTYAVPNYQIYQPAKYSEAQMEGMVFFSESERLDAFSANVGMEASGGFAGFGAKVSVEGSYGQSQGTQSSKKSVSFFATAWQSKYWLMLDKKHARLSPGFIDYTLQRRNFSDAIEAQTYFENVGTHYPLAVLYGGRIYKDESVEESSFGKSLATEWSVSGSAGGSAYGVEVAMKAGYGEESSRKQFNSTELSKLTCKSLGGTSATSFENWSLDGTDDLVPIRLELRPIYDLIRPDYFPGKDSNKIQILRQQMEKAFKTYITSRRTPSGTFAGKPRIFEVSFNRPDLDMVGLPNLTTNRTTTKSIATVTMFPVEIPRKNGTEWLYPLLPIPVLARSLSKQEQILPVAFLQLLEEKGRDPLKPYNGNSGFGPYTMKEVKFTLEKRSSAKDVLPDPPPWRN